MHEHSVSTLVQRLDARCTAYKYTILQSHNHIKISISDMHFPRIPIMEQQYFFLPGGGKILDSDVLSVVN
jgi:hypothetical protein